MPTRLSIPTEEQFDRIGLQNKFFAGLAEAGEGLVPDDPTLLEELQRKTAVAVSGVAMVSALHAAPAAASAPEMPTPIVRIANNVAPTTTVPADKAPQPIATPVASDGKITHTVRVLGAEANIVAAAPVEPLSNQTALTSKRVIKPGDTLGKVARELGIDLSHLEAANKNDMPDPDLIFSGQVADYDPSQVDQAKVNAAKELTKPFVAPEGTVTEPIVWGDTLSAKALAHETTVDRLVQDNTGNPSVKTKDLIFANGTLAVPKAPETQPAASFTAATVAEATPAAAAPEATVTPPAPVEQAAPAPPAPEAPPPPMSKIFNVAAIPDQFHGFGGQQIRQDMERLMDVHNLAPNAAAQLGGTFLRVAGNDHTVTLPDGRFGLIGAGSDLREGMGSESRENQIDLIVRRMQERRPDLYLVLVDRNTTPEDARKAIDQFIGHGDTDGKREKFGKHIGWYLHAQKGVPLQPPFTLEAEPIPSQEFNPQAIPEDFFAPGMGRQIRVDIARLMDIHGLSPNGAAHMVGTFLQEAGNDHTRVHARENGYGLIGAQGGREQGMRTQTREEQIDVIIRQMQESYPESYKVVIDRNATHAQIRNAMYKFIVWGIEGNRTEWGQQLAYFLHVPKGEAPRQTFSVASAQPPTPVPAPVAPQEAAVPDAPVAESSLQESIDSMIQDAVGPILEAAQEALNPKTGAQVEEELRAKYGNVSGKLRAEDLEVLDGPWVGHRLHPVAVQSLKAMNHEYYLRFGRSIELTDSYRNYAEQVAVKREKGDWAARPGTSTHGWGLAIDVRGLDFGDEEYKWFMENAGRFGWENPEKLRDGKGIDEAWHLEKVG